MAIRKGMAAVDEGGATGGGFSGRLGYFNLKKDGDSCVVRFITDLDKDVITLDFWEFIIDNKDKPQNFAVAADVHDDPNAVDYVLQYEPKMRQFGTNDLIDPTPKTRSVGLAVLCEEVATEGANGRKKLSYVPAEIDIDTKKGIKKGYQFLVVKQAYKNFWAPLKTNWSENGKTICDRYFKIIRVGSGNDTTYTFMEKTPDEDWWDDSKASYEALKKEFGYGEKTDFDGDDDDRFKKVPQTLEEWAADSCSKKRVDYFLGDVEARDNQGKDKDGDGKPSAAKTAARDDSEDEETAAPPPATGGIRDRMKRHQVAAAGDDE